MLSRQRSFNLSTRSSRVDLIGMDKIIKENSATLNVENTSSANGKLKFVLIVYFYLF
jgi:hypothetical protein